MVSSVSPRQHSGPTVVTRSRSKSPHKKKFMLRSSPQIASSPFNSPAVKVTKSPALRNFTPLHHKSFTTSPIKFPLSLATTSELNTATSAVTPPPNLSHINPMNKESPGSPTIRHTMQRGHRAGINAENGRPGSPLLRIGSPVKDGNSLSPVKRGRGSPVPKRRTNVNYDDMDSPFPGPSISPLKQKSPQKATARRNSLKRNANQPNTAERPTYAKARPQSRIAEFATPTDPASRIRRTASVRNSSAAGSLPNASIHPHNLITGGRSLLKESGTTEMDWVTPQNYKQAKPNPAAFHSTGFVPKRGRLITDSTSHHQPETPCKKLSSYSTQMSSIQPTFGDFSSPIAGSKGKSFKLHNEGDLSPTPLSTENSLLDRDFDEPTTPTKPVYTNLVPLFGNVGGTKRKGECKFLPHQSTPPIHANLYL